jgi:DNA polymerase I
MTTGNSPSISSAEARPRLCLVDGPGYIFRAFFGIKQKMNAPDGTPTNAVFGFNRMLRQLIRDMKPDYVAVIFDTGEPTFRHGIYPAYKANRDAPPEEMIPQFTLIDELVAAYGLPVLKRAGFEADDIIATLATTAESHAMDVVIISSDKDLMQLVDDRVRLYDPLNERFLGREAVIEKFGVPPEKVVDVQALAGDSTDGVPGVPGVGIKTAAELVNTYGSLDEVLARAGEVKQPKRREALLANADLARTCRELVRLKRDMPGLPTIESLKRPDDEAPATKARLNELFVRLGFRSQLTLEATGPAAGEGTATTPAPAPAKPAEASDGDRPNIRVAAIDRDRYELVLDEAALNRWIEKARAVPALALDFETTSLNPHEAIIVGCSLATADNDACYIPVAHRYMGAPPQLKPGHLHNALRAIFTGPGAPKLWGQNAKYDWLVAHNNGVTLPEPAGDSMIASYLLDATRSSHGMDNLSRVFLGHETVKFSDVTGTGKHQIGFDEVPLDQALRYAAEDADVTFRLCRILHRMLHARDLTDLYYGMEIPLLSVLARMELNGVRLDSNLLHTMGRDLVARQHTLEQEIHRLAGQPFNVNSPKQLAQVLFTQLGLPIVSQTKTGPSTDASVLEELSDKHPLPKLVLEFRMLAKLQGTYVEALPKLVNPSTGRLHTSFNQTVAETGRLSSTDPNLQNIPIRTEDGRRIREAFIAADGATLVSADYSQVELRVMAHIARDEAMIRAFNDGADIHRQTAAEMFGHALADVTPEERRRAKAINFGVIYGQSGFGLAQSLGIGRGEAERYIEQYFERFKGVRAFITSAIENAKDTGEARTLFGRIRPVPELRATNKNIKQQAERVAVNTVIQGTAADLIKAAMIRLDRRLAREMPETKMLLQVHDELVFETPAGSEEQLASMAREEMAAPLKLAVPLVVDVGTGPNWAKAH